MGVMDVYKVERTSKAGNPYTQLCVEFENGYVLKVFLSDEQKIILTDVPVLNK